MGNDPVTRFRLIHGILSRELNDMFELLDRILSKKSVFESNYPLMDVFVYSDEIKVLVDLPGVKLEDFKVYLYENNLILEGYKSDIKYDQKVTYFRMERDFFPFRRAISLPEDIDEDNVKAALKDGVLEIIINRKKREE
ncbi:Hsp20/alpha crystallin family protein [Deferribacter autotrophicus]|uniref:Hsp20/alpha crystallin family protein n=1 Tax=Deferribacter autotrophicus TaxID=500465 RepID=A0A5A8F3H6_9BACT|nr:Hsp20/alpha crystallin family protein [Deferribacter autotrophicus]KAA0258408.1 Hsp20/alpha crystallin family protein [Deferribacter autotrophicus]